MIFIYIVLVVIVVYYFRRNIDVKLVSTLLKTMSSMVGVLISAALPVQGHMLLMCNTIVQQVITHLVQKLDTYVCNSQQTTLHVTGSAQNMTFESIAVTRFIFDQKNTGLKIPAVSIYCDLTKQKELMFGVLTSPIQVFYKDVTINVTEKGSISLTATNNVLTHVELSERLQSLVQKYVSGSLDHDVPHKQRLCIPSHTNRGVGNLLYNACLSFWNKPFARTATLNHVAENVSVEQHFLYSTHDVILDSGSIIRLEHGKNSKNSHVENVTVCVVSGEDDALDEFLDKLHGLAKYDANGLVINNVSLRTVKKKIYSDDLKSFQIDEVTEWVAFSTKSAKSPSHFFWTRRVEREVLSQINLILKQQKKRALFGIPLRENFILQGQPGTGKTSFVNYLALKLTQIGMVNVQIAHIDSKTLSDKRSFVQIMQQLGSKDSADSCQIVLIDEADKLPFFETIASKDNSSAETKHERSNFVEFLRWLDGSTESSNRFVFATANDVSSLFAIDRRYNGALMRPGRFSHVVHVGGTDSKQLLEFCQCAFGKQFKRTSLYKIVAEKCDSTCDDAVSPLTPKILETILCECDFEFNAFIKKVHALFNKK